MPVNIIPFNLNKGTVKDITIQTCEFPINVLGMIYAYSDQLRSAFYDQSYYDCYSVDIDGSEKIYVCRVFDQSGLEPIYLWDKNPNEDNEPLGYLYDKHYNQRIWCGPDDVIVFHSNDEASIEVRGDTPLSKIRDMLSSKEREYARVNPMNDPYLVLNAFITLSEYLANNQLDVYSGK